MTTNPSRFWIIKYVESAETATTVAKYDWESKRHIPDNIANHDRFIIDGLDSRDSLAAESVDHSVLSEDDKTTLSQIYPVNIE